MSFPRKRESRCHCRASGNPEFQGIRQNWTAAPHSSDTLGTWTAAPRRNGTLGTWIPACAGMTPCWGPGLLPRAAVTPWGPGLLPRAGMARGAIRLKCYADCRTYQAQRLALAGLQALPGTVLVFYNNPRFLSLVCGSEVCGSEVCRSDICRSDICRSEVCRSDVCRSEVAPVQIDSLVLQEPRFLSLLFEKGVSFFHIRTFQALVTSRSVPPGECRTPS